MQANGWTVADLSRESGVDHTVIARWLNPQRANHQPTLRTATAERLMAALKLVLKYNQ